MWHHESMLLVLVTLSSVCLSLVALGLVALLASVVAHW
jgi:hypothetical protein